MNSVKQYIITIYICLFSAGFSLLARIGITYFPSDSIEVYIGSKILFPMTAGAAVGKMCETMKVKNIYTYILYALCHLVVMVLSPFIMNPEVFNRVPVITCLWTFIFFISSLLSFLAYIRQGNK